MYISILMSRLIVKFLPFSSDYKEIPTKHLPHEHAIEMASKIEIVSVTIELWLELRPHIGHL